MAKDLSLQRRKDLAYSIYMAEDATQEEIAERTGLSKVTIGKCIKNGLWKDLKEAMSISREEQLKSFTSQLNELNRCIQSREEKFRFPTSKEVDIQIKLSKAINMLKGDASLVDLITFSKLFVKYLRTNHPERVKELSLLINEFITDNA